MCYYYVPNFKIFLYKFVESVSKSIRRYDKLKSYHLCGEDFFRSLFWGKKYLGFNTSVLRETNIDCVAIVVFSEL